MAVDGRVQQDGETLRTEAQIAGPAGASGRVSGVVQPDIDIDLAGTAPLGLLNRVLAPRSLQGDAAFALNMRGTALSDLQGNVRLSNGRLVAPNAGITFENIAGAIGLSAGRAQINLSAAPDDGGRVDITGTAGLSGRYPGDLAVRLSSVVLEDPTLYRTQLNGTLNVIGPLQGGARIAGRIDVGETEISVPSTALGGLSPIPNIKHVGASAPVQATRRRAGLTSQASSSGSSSSVAYPLDILISAPRRVFVRGRGLDAELGGSLSVTGTTSRPISAGEISLIRGRLDILGQRFTLDEGRISLLGDFEPFIDFRATTDTDTGTASVLIEGRATEPDVSFEASPSLPQDEVLAQILFGRSISELSAFQALRLASAVATLAGRKGVDLMSRLREGFGLDDLDVATDDEGNTEVRLGRYLTDNVYTDVTIGENGQTGVSLNIDLSPSLTARGQTRTDGNSSLGIFWERDY